MIEEVNNKFKSIFAEKFCGSVLVYRADDSREILFANPNVCSLFGCDSMDEFMEYVGGSFNGIVGESQRSNIEKEIKVQLAESSNNSGYVFFNIKTKKGDVCRLVDHWTLVHDEMEGDVFCAALFRSHLDNVIAEVDRVTGLTTKVRFKNLVMGTNIADAGNENIEYGIVYINLVNFKLLNYNMGISEGDRCLNHMANILRDVYDDAFISRLSDDHFAVFAECRDIIEKTNEVRRRFLDTYGTKFNIIGKYGLFRFSPDDDFDFESALSMAKIACDYIKKDSKQDIAEYNEQIARDLNATEYVIRKLDRAIDEGWIEVYYQPVIRSITGQLCGMESLVRWNDPRLGFLGPDNFIGILEDNMIIHKLDVFVVDQVCKLLHDRMEKGLPVVPISVNFSRLDFILCDMLKVVEDAVEKYDVPRDYIHIEITESMIASDEDMMRGIIEKFRNVGYEIWMDDFGSGYSSLTLLKDYKFDMLKLDMRFLTPFTERAKDIVRATISMAKDIGIKTLAEGVETREHLDFLKEIGCGMIQGYYYGRPEPIDKVFQHLEEKNIDSERRNWRYFYDVAGRHVRDTDTPLEIIEDDGKEIRTLFMNRSYKEQIFEGDYDLAEIDRRIYHTGSPLLRKYREFANILEKSGKEETFYYTDNGNYLQLRARALIENQGHYIIKASLLNLSRDQMANKSEKLDAKLRELNQLFEVVLHAKLSERKIEPLLGGFKYIYNGDDSYADVDETIDIFLAECIFPTERGRYRRFVSYLDIRGRIEATGDGYITEVFRIKQQDGSYEKKEITIMMIPGTNGDEYLFCIKPHTILKGDEADSLETTLRRRGVTDKSAESIIQYANLWGNMLERAETKLFWKDRKRRFCGVSQAFLDFYELESVEDVLGKTDEDMHWHLDNDLYRDDELDIISKGISVRDVIGQSIVNGVVHNIMCNKMPIYDNGKIVGLVGYFVDIDEKEAHAEKDFSPFKLDPVTGLMNAHAFLDVLIDYAIQYNEKGRNYGVIIFNNTKYSRICESYGKEFAQKVLKEVGDNIIDIAGQTCAVARIKESIFAVLTYTDNYDDLGGLAKRIENRLNAINLVDGRNVTMRFRSAYNIRNTRGLTDENIYETTLREVVI